jgi:hypothetical protein
LSYPGSYLSFHNLNKKIMEAIRKKTHRSQQEMFTLLETFKESGISQHLFCKQHNLSYSVFQYWLKKYKKETSASEEGFVELKPCPKLFQAVRRLFSPLGLKLFFHPAIRPLSVPLFYNHAKLIRSPAVFSLPGQYRYA